MILLETFTTKMWNRITNAILTVPNTNCWQPVLIFLLIITAIMLLLGFMSGFLQIDILKAPWQTIVRILIITFFVPSFAEELFFRVLLLPHRTEEVSIASQWIWGSLSLVIFIVYHPLNALTFSPKMVTVFINPTFLGLVGTLGVTCTITYLKSGTLWISVLIHWLYVKQQEKLFELWHRVRDGTLKRCEFQLLVQQIRNTINFSLQEAANYEIGSKEKTPLAKTVRTCRQLLKVESALWKSRES